MACLIISSLKLKREMMYGWGTPSVFLERFKQEKHSASSFFAQPTHRGGKRIDAIEWSKGVIIHIYTQVYIRMSVSSMYTTHMFHLFKKEEVGQAIGLDIGTASVKIVQLRREKEKIILDTYGEIALGPYG